jgi:TraM recognition site of TraD and TraG/Helicase HerA, central domain
MSSLEYAPESGTRERLSLAHLIHGLPGSSVHLALALVAGWLLALQMHRRGVRWTWPALALVVFAATRPSLDGYGSSFAAAALCAAVLARRRHRRDLIAGGDLAEAAAQSRGPLAALRGAAGRICPQVQRAVTTRLDNACRAREKHRPGRLPLGRTAQGRRVSIAFAAGTAGGRHTLIVGATGSGKTVTTTVIAGKSIELGMGVVAVDPKGDARLRGELASRAEACGRRMICWTPDGPAAYNPYARGGASEIADKALAGERFTEPHYQRQAQRYLGHEARALIAGGVDVSLDALVRYLEPTRLELLLRTLPVEQARETHAYLDSLTVRQQNDLAGVRDRLAIMAESDVARWLDPSTFGADRFDLLAAIRERAVVYFDLRADSRPLLAQMLGAAIVIDLQSAVSALQSAPVPTLVAIDEFSALATEQVTRLFGRARAAGVSLLLGTQELSDLRTSAGNDATLLRVLGNLSTLIAHRQVVPGSAELVARMCGDRGAWRTSQRSDGRWTRTRVSIPSTSVEAIRTLPDGCAAVLHLAGAGEACVTRITAPATTPPTDTVARSER